MRKSDTNEPNPNGVPIQHAVTNNGVTGKPRLTPKLQQAEQDAFVEMELGTVGAAHAFQRWIASCMKSAGLKDLTPVDVLVMHHVNHGSHNRRLGDICFVLNIEDTHVVAYSIRKLIGLGVISSDKHGKEVTYSTTSLGQEYLLRYREIRERHLVDALATLGLNKSLLEELAQYLRKMSGLYDQAARAASSL
ncbi:transcriptional regulator [Noviherbaspirillum cavernae]|uniref:Transcriptional regulator n=1 Tax=Noviherbaspirillum cavernae TaxID=2320862 RepID=A0A418WW68_9BURK|nr:winged helix DNA-binding protein [Noviherbaspirillum cavernae]RJF96903.1 transcriptional regulator [Noviherbaspirillum cavernae]